MKRVAYVLFAFLTPLLMSCETNREPEGGFVSSDGLADNDRDGVINQHDLCDNTPRTTTVDENGCRVEQSLDATSDVFFVRFEANSANLSHREQLRLRSRVSAFTGEHVASIEVEPHRADDESDAILRGRAEAVEAFLLSLGVGQALIEVVPDGTISERYQSESESEVENRVNSRVSIRVNHSSSD
jgi:outer membrane protein OmpA-like peptidoglycan-associated protein